MPCTTSHIPLLAKTMRLQVFYLQKDGFSQKEAKPYKLQQLEVGNLPPLHVGAA
jgi:hypothetical protein